MTLGGSSAFYFSDEGMGEAVIVGACDLAPFHTAAPTVGECQYGTIDFPLGLALVTVGTEIKTGKPFLVFNMGFSHFLNGGFIGAFDLDCFVTGDDVIVGATVVGAETGEAVMVGDAVSAPFCFAPNPTHVLVLIEILLKLIEALLEKKELLLVVTDLQLVSQGRIQESVQLQYE